MAACPAPWHGPGTAVTDEKTHPMKTILALAALLALSACGIPFVPFI